MWADIVLTGWPEGALKALKALLASKRTADFPVELAGRVGLEAGEVRQAIRLAAVILGAH